MDDEKPKECCEKCKYFIPYYYEFDEVTIPTDYGECRRFPPKRVPVEEVGFPVVEDTSWCGEFRN